MFRKLLKQSLSLNEMFQKVFEIAFMMCSNWKERSGLSCKMYRPVRKVFDLRVDPLYSILFISCLGETCNIKTDVSPKTGKQVLNNEDRMFYSNRIFFPCKSRKNKNSESKSCLMDKKKKD